MPKKTEFPLAFRNDQVEAERGNRRINCGIAARFARGGNGLKNRFTGMAGIASDFQICFDDTKLSNPVAEFRNFRENSPDFLFQINFIQILHFFLDIGFSEE